MQAIIEQVTDGALSIGGPCDLDFVADVADELGEKLTVNQMR